MDDNKTNQELETEGALPDQPQSPTNGAVDSTEQANDAKTAAVDTGTYTGTSPQAERSNDSMPEMSEAATTSSAPASMPPVQPKQAWFKQKKIIIAVATVLVAVLVGAYFIFFADSSNDEVETSVDTSEQQVIKRFGVAPGLVEGVVEYSEDGMSWSVMDDAMTLEEGMSIKTGGDGRVVLLVDDGSAVRLSYSSEVLLKSLDTSDVVIEQKSGEVYSRVVASEKRKYSVVVEEEIYEAKGTAYRTTNKETVKGVEVFHSSVEAAEKNALVSEGNAYFTKADVPEKENVITALDLEALKLDAFIAWNAEQDKKESEFADKLGVLADIDKIPEKPVTPVAPKPSSSTTGISLKGVQSEFSAVFSWTSGSVDVSNGFKLVASTKSKTPTYPENSVAYISAGKTSYTHFVGDGGTYYYRLCAYRDGTCDSYSNMVTVTTKKKEKPPIEAGALTLSISGNTLSWTVGGTAPNGFKIAMNTTGNPTYPEHSKKYVSDTSASVPNDGLVSGTTYSIRVCKYTYEGACQDYSNEVQYVAP